MVKISSSAKTPKLAQPMSVAKRKAATKSTRSVSAKKKPAGLTIGQMEDDVHLEQAATLLAMFRKHAERFKKEPVTQELAGLAHCYWSEYPLWLNMMGVSESKQRVPQSIHSARFALDHAHRLAMRVLMKFAASRGVDLPSALSIGTAATLCREMYHDDFERYFPHGAQCDQWPLSLGAELLKLPADQRQAIQAATATLQQIDVSEFVAGSQTTFVAAKPPDGEQQPPQLDGPFGLGCFRWRTLKPRCGLRLKPFRLLTFLWNAKDRTATFDELAEDVWDDKQRDGHALRNDSRLGSARRAVNEFMEAGPFPFCVKTSPENELVWLIESTTQPITPAKTSAGKKARRSPRPARQ